MRSQRYNMIKTIHQDFTETIRILRKDRFSKDGAIILFIILATSSLVLSYSLTCFLLSAYVIGLVICYAFIKLQGFASSSLLRLVYFYKGHISASKKNGRSCTVCHNPSCDRHRQDFLVAPWNDLLIDDQLNKAIEKFYSKLLDMFVSSWYGHLTKDESFIHELRYALKYSTAIVIRRIIEIDLATLMSRKILPCIVKHVDDVIYIEDIAKLKKRNINDVAIEYWGNKLHGAVTNRSNELVYLRELAASLLPIILPPKYFQCRNSSTLFQELIAGWVLLPVMDTAFNPNIINSMIVMGANYKPKHSKLKEYTTQVYYLQNFECPVDQKKSLFYRDLNEVKENTELLYTFIQFLKDEDQVHLLKFCLDVDQFSNILMTPDHSKKTLDELYGSALAIYNEYFCLESSNFIKCNNSISQEMKDLLKDGIHSIAKLKISAPLMEAYKVVFNNLEENWLPLFYKSNEFYKYLCGMKSSSQFNRAQYNENNKQGTAPLTPRLGGLRKLKSAFMNSSPVEGSRVLPEKQSFDSVGEIISPICYNIFRDISTWTISISSYVSLNKVIYFHVNVKRPSSANNEAETSRVVLRKDQDFFTLKAKLVEFHGENEITDSPLPARKAGSDIGTRMAGYEKFLQKILQNNTLRGSDLLYTFLTTEDDFSLYLSTCGAPVQDLSNIYQSVTQKLRKEKGQHLDNFMNVFMSSTGNEKSGKFSTLEVGDEVDPLNAMSQDIPSKTFHNSVFNDNFKILFNKSRRNTTSSVNPLNILECLFYIAKHILNVPLIVLRFYVATCNMVGDTLEYIWCIFIQKKLAWFCQQHLEYLVTCLQVIFEDLESPATLIESEKHKEEALKVMTRIFNEFPYNLLGKNFSNGVVSFWEVIQNPLFNKQLAYQLLDILLLEMYPNILLTKK
ncbi:sorting nexin-14-like isoform X2 [Coccinella septempunctata]|uniref:sorting nexin-14-like isoform X2 n=1 Tax=Coccinella septempunctata TaxID=41139 RepID=UPI001D05D791|nr:sorting nexin-14-like isoform X2 [Coccinella septempunctata]